MPELGSLGTVRGALRNERPYRENSAETPGMLGETADFDPSWVGRRSAALDYSAAFFAAALRAPVFLRAGTFIPALRPRPRDFASSERLAA